MNVFYHRPLFTACMLFLSVSAMAYFISAQAKLIVLAVFAVVLIVSSFMCLLAKLSVRSKCFLTHAVLCSLSVTLAMGISFSYFDTRYESFDKMYENEYTIEATVLSKNYESEFFNSYDIQVSKVNGKNNNHTATLTCEYSAGADVGSVIIVKAMAVKPEDNKESVFNEKLSMLSDGKFVLYESYDDIGIIITEHTGFNVKLLFAKWNSEISNIITQRVDGEAGNLSSAILLGNKHLLSDETVRDFSRAGVSHILALSGMHMTIIMGAFTVILWMFTDNRKKIGIFSSLAAVFYLALTGFSISATRAVLMLLIVYLAMIIFNEPDPLTSLSVAGALIVAFLPGSVLDAGFWMSFAATFGLLVFMPPVHGFITDKLYSLFKGKARRVIVRSIVFALDLVLASVFAWIPLVVVMCIFIKEISVFSIISSAVLSLPSSALILMSLMLILFHYVPYVCGALVYFIELISGFMMDFCSELSVADGAVFSLNYPFITAFAVILGIALLYCIASKHKKKLISVIPFVCCVILLFATMGIYESTNSDKVKATYINASSASDIIVLSSENKAVICDLSNGSKSAYSKALDEIYAARATEIEAIMLTAYSYQHSATFTDIFASKIVRSVWMPYPENDDEYYKMKRIYEVADSLGVTAYIYKQGEELTAFSDTKIQVYKDSIERSAVPITLINVNTINKSLLYTSPAFNESEQYELTEELFAKSDYVIFGNKGPLVKKEYTIANNHRIDAIAFSNRELAAYFDTEPIRGSAYFYVPEKIEFYLDK